ncbi:MAG: di-heme oxidoredictase family protein [Bacteroidia bacterium]|jgi:CxxC motif-containing protein (DUF1111 family)
MKKNKLSISLLLAFWMILVLACSKFEPDAPAEEDTLDGPVAGLSGEQHQQFLAGDRAFNDEVFTAENGLGPVFVAASCGSCHAGDGKGHPFVALTRFGQVDSTGNKFLDKGGPQLQHKALPGYEPEQIPAGATSTRLVAPMNSGMGYLELVSDADILSMSDPTDANGDGISGVPNWNKVPAYITPPAGSAIQNGKYICRFGKKGSAYNLLQQTAGAYNQDMGITSTYEPKDVFSGEDLDPEVSNQTVQMVVFYLRTLKAPKQRNPQDVTVAAGKQVFLNAGCASCHKEQLKTGSSTIPQLAGVTIYPYTDLLLHDMGPGLDDGYTEGSATTAEWKTPPLWGLGLVPASQGGQYFLLHDGRAKSIEEAIEWHGGEATGSVTKYKQLSGADKQALVTFLKSL